MEASLRPVILRVIRSFLEQTMMSDYSMIESKFILSQRLFFNIDFA